MFSSRMRLLALAVAVWLPSAVPARAASLPPRAEVGLASMPSGIDVAAFRQVVSSRYHVHFRVVVAADIDRDGDIDVLASTEHSLTVWVNDGAGHLKAQRLPQGPAAGVSVPGNAWRERERRVDPTLPGNASPSPVLVVRGHAPPVSGLGVSRASRIARIVTPDLLRSSPRAPPA
jgi:hypothetical protein